MLDTQRQDVRIAFRSLWREPGVTAVALCSLAIGIAANATVFSLVQAVEFPQLIYPDASRIVFIESRNLPRDLSELPISAPDALDLAAATPRTLATPALTVDESVTIREAATPAHWAGREVAPAFFDVMKINARDGRVLREGDEAVIVLADGFWRRQLGADPAIVGRVIHVNDEPRTVVGVMPPRFDLDADFWLPLTPSTLAAAARDDRRFTTFARLPDGVSLTDASREIAAVSARLAAEHPATNSGWEMFPTALTRMHGQDSHGAFLLLQAAVAFVLLIACANIANILLARGTRRGHEMAVRLALGASRRRLVGQLLTESLLLALAGGVVGTLLTMWGIRLARGLYDFPEAIDPSLNPLVLAFTAIVSALTGLICGVLPALRASRVAPQTTLQAEGTRGATGHAARGRLRAVLVAVQVASAVVLATGAGLLVQSLINRQHVDLGFNPAGAVRADLSLSGARFASDGSQRAAAEAVLDRIRRDPAVSAAGAQAWALSAGVGARRQLSLPTRGNTAAGTGAPNAIEAITPEYFSAMAVPIRQGRAFTDADRPGAPLVAIINDEFARHFWPDRSPIGDVVRLGAPDTSAPQVTIVGVVGSIRRSAMHGFVVSRIYVPYAQFPGPSLALVVRARADVGAAMNAMQAAVRQTDASLVLDAQRTVEADVAEFVQPVRFITVLLTAFGVAGALLTALGVFGTMSYAVSQRRREMAVRAALGASRADILRLVLGSGLRITALGLSAGVVAALVATRALTSFLFGVAPADPITLGLVAAALAVVALAACYRPARMAATVDPMTVLRRD
jgi:putative ABC transport system permease protein